MYKALIDRVKQNYADYERRMVGGYSKQDIFDIAGRIHAVSDAYSYMTATHNFSEAELRFLLQFQNPLDMVAQHWRERNMDIGDMSFTMDFIMEPERQRRLLEKYSLVSDTTTQAAEQTADEPEAMKVPLTPREQIYKKLSAEYDAFIADLKGKTPDKIIESAYEKVYKEQILMCFEHGDEFREKAMGILLALENPLDDLYWNWVDTDVSDFDDLSDTISGFIVRELERQDEIDTPTPKTPYQHTEETLNHTARGINGELSVGGYVIVAPHDDYGHLVGEVIYIDKLGTPEHDTGNPGDDVHVSFRAFIYPPWQQNAFAEHFSELVGSVYRPFHELPLDDVIIASDALISLDGISIERINELITDFDEADNFCKSVIGERAITEPTIAAEPLPQPKPKTPTAPREPSLLDEVREAAREIEAQKVEKPAHTTKKHDKGIE
jgi:hypothetical protein